MYAATYIPLGRRNTFLKCGAFVPVPNSRNFIVTEEVQYIDPDGNLVIVPVGFVTDFASIPPLARFAAIFALVFQLLARYWPRFYFLEAFAFWVCYVAEWLENSGTDEIAAVHDFYYATRCVGFWRANWNLFKGMIANGATHNNLLKRILFYLNVTLFGIIPWINDARKKKASESFQK